MTHSKIAVGDILAVRKHHSSFNRSPRISHDLYIVTHLTATQAKAEFPDPKINSQSIRVRLKDLKIIGHDYEFAVIASSDIIAQNEKENQIKNRWIAAKRRIVGLDDGQPCLRDLSVEQLEALADAWERVQAMETGVCSTPRACAGM